MGMKAKTIMGMKAKTIKTVLRKKIDDWLQTIDDEHVRGLAAKNTIVTGGCIASMLLGDQVNDFDVYFANHETTLAIANYYTNKFTENAKETTFKSSGKVVDVRVDDTDGRVSVIVKSAGIACEEGSDGYQYFEGVADPDAAADYVSDVMEKGTSETTDPTKPKYRPVFLSTNAITLSDKIQLVLRFYGNPDELHENYDFVHCMNYWESRNGGMLTLRPEALEALLAYELRYIGSKYPVCSLIRTRKFIQRGWKINAGQYLKMCMQVSQLDLQDINVLQDQLTGVDVAYFNEVIHKLKDRQKEGELKIDSTYLVEIINKLF